MGQENTRRGEVTKSMGELLGEVWSGMNEIRQELQEWMDNMPGNLQEGERYVMLGEAVYCIESIHEFECPSKLEKEKVTWVARTGKKSRSERRDDHTAALQAAIAVVRRKDDAELGGFLDELEGALNDYEGIKFPGMH